MRDSNNGHSDKQFITWKRVAIFSFIVLGMIMGGGATLMISVSNSHVTATELPGRVAAITAPLSDTVERNGNRITILETDQVYTKAQFAAINAKLDRIMELLK